MQIKKDEVENAIIRAAEKEFIEKGYKNASLRSISKKSGVSLSNIYNYFNSKDKLYQHILSPLISSINNVKTFLKNHSEDEETFTMDFHLKFLEPVVDFIDSNRDFLKMLLMNSYGSSYENYFDDFTEWYTDLSISAMENISIKKRAKPVRINRFVAHNLVAFWVQFLRESLMHDINREELLEYAKDLMSFTYSGWMGLLENRGE